MSAPQLENGHVRIANELVDRFARTNLSPYEWRTLWALIRKTYGWNKTTDRISVRQFCRLTGLKYRHQIRTLRKLEVSNFITRFNSRNSFSYRLQKNFDEWRPIPLKVSISIDTSGGIRVIPPEVSKNDTSRGINKRHYKDTSVKTRQGETPCDPPHTGEKEKGEKGEDRGGGSAGPPVPPDEMKTLCQEAYLKWPETRRGALEQWEQTYHSIVRTPADHKLLMEFMRSCLAATSDPKRYARTYVKMFDDFANLKKILPRKGKEEQEMLLSQFRKEIDDALDKVKSLDIEDVERYHLVNALRRAQHAVRQYSFDKKRMELYRDEIDTIKTYFPSLAEKITLKWVKITEL